MNSRPRVSPSGYHAFTGKGVPAGVSPNTMVDFRSRDAGRYVERVNFNAYSFEPSRLVTFTTSALPCGFATANVYVPAGSVTPGSCTARLNVKCVVRSAFPNAPVDDVASTPRSTTPHNVWTILRANILSSLITSASACAVRSAVVNAPTAGTELEGG